MGTTGGFGPVLETDEVQVQIAALSAALIRVQMVPRGGVKPAQRSYAVTTSADYGSGCEGSLREQNHSLLWQTHCSAAQGLTVIIEKDPPSA